VELNGQQPTVGDVSTAKTPVGRLAWQDLMGSRAEEKPAEEVSPTERVLWKTGKDDKLAALMSPMLPQAKHGKKRARSSSPSSSPSHSSQPVTPAVNVKKLAEALKTPHADPALDLWDRFSLATGPANNADNGPRRDFNPLLTHLMVSSSPRPAVDGTPSRKTRDMRRSVSAAEPGAKRRRVELPIDDRSPLNPERGVLNTGFKVSMLSHLLETVTGELDRSEPDPIPQPINPVPQRSNTTSPARERQRQSPVRICPHSDVGLMGHKHADASITPESGLLGDEAAGGDARSDYGSDDFDDDVFMDLDASFMTADNTMETHIEPPKASVTAVPIPAAEPQRRPTSSSSKTAEDDFGDFDPDLTTAVEDLVAKINSQGAPQAHGLYGVSSGDRGQAGPPTVDMGDEFGGDYELDEALLAATQQSERTSKVSSLSHVCTD
jgi:DNA replication ATP-dependent helicase Dna2